MSSSFLAEAFRTLPPPWSRRVARRLQSRFRRVRRELSGPWSFGNLLLEPLRLRPLASKEDSLPARSTLFDRKHLEALSGTIARLRLADPYLRHRLTEVGGLRGWEYGMLLRALPDPSGHRVLDIGAGASTLPAYLARKGGRVTALDLLDPYSAPLASIARRSNRHGVRLVLGSMLALPFADGTLDAVVSISAIEHLGHEKGRERVVPRNEFWSRTKVALAEMARVLRPSGLFYLTSEIYVEGRVEGDRWWGSLAEGSVVGAYPATAIGEIFLDPLRRLGIALEGGVDISPELLVADPDRSNFRDRFISTFCLVGRKRP